ncbi:hypothetical protein GE09DRAFT_1244464 [Coniochaeta sp. 2T2.1]|nr:hypothetical protein GE09DRAFT_1244464 [Coniochaeta sp. 2T2.1]
MDFASDHEDKKRQDGLIATALVMAVVAGSFVILRCVGRFVLIRNSGKDDYLIIGAMVLIIGYVINLFVMKHNHMGYPMTMLTPDNMTAMIKTTLAIQLMYYAIVCCIKTSILFTYLRFALTRTFRVLCGATIVLHTVFFFICFVVTISQCRPLHKMWDLTKTEPGTCINTTAFFYSTSAFNIITDVWILALPIPTLRSIQRPSREKIALFLIFGAGTFAAISSVVRLHTIYRYTEAADPFKESILVNLWSMIEVCVAVACASVPALKPVFSRGQRMRSRRAAGTLTDKTHASESRSRSRLMSLSGLGKWHMRLGSKDLTEYSPAGSQSADTEKQADTLASPPLPQATPIRQMQPAVVHHEDGRPGPRPMPFSPRQGSWLRGMDSSDTDSSMLVFTPLTPRTMGYAGPGNKDGRPGLGPSMLSGNGMSSSGSTLILQKPNGGG